MGTLPQEGGSVPTRLTNSSEEASVFEFSGDHNLRLHHSELLSGTDREFNNVQILGGETRYSSLHFGWSPTTRLTKYLVPHAFIVDMQAGKVGHQLRTIVNETYSTDIIGIDDAKVVHLAVGERHVVPSGGKEPEVRELRSFYKLEAMEFE